MVGGIQVLVALAREANTEFNKRNKQQTMIIKIYYIRLRGGSSL